MHDAALEARPITLLRAGVQVSVASIVWTVVANSAAVAFGLATGSIVLIAFGVTGLLDAAGSVSLVVHFRHAIRHEVFSQRHEHLALQIVTLGLLTVGVVAAGASVQRLFTGSGTKASTPGIVLAAASIVVLAGLAFRKQRVATRVRSRALRADGWLTVTGCGLAAVTVVGTALTASLGWWWADPVAAIGVACAAFTIAVVMRRAKYVGQ